jgi:hypothetical protein
MFRKASRVWCAPLKERTQMRIISVRNNQIGRRLRVLFLRVFSGRTAAIAKQS